MNAPVIGYAGMTHLGLMSAAAAAAHGLETIAFDPDSDLIAALKRGDLPISEPGLPETLARTKQRLMFTDRLSELAQCDVVYVAVDVPTDEQGQSDLAPVHEMIAAIAPALGAKSSLVVLSQVPPGFTRKVQFPANRLFYQVETLVFGCALERATKPERFIVGCADARRPLPAPLAAYLGAFNCPLLPMSYESAELAKIAINCFLVSSVSTANALAEISETVGADWSEIVPALRLDARIGAQAYLTPGLGIAGGNLERDLRTVVGMAEAGETDAGVVRAWLANSAHRRDWAWRTLQSVAKRDARIAVLGLAYKENTRSTMNSPALALLAKLRGRTVTVHDPQVPASIVPWASAAKNALAAAKGADALVVATAWPEYRELSPVELARAMRGCVILDPYRVLDGRACAAAGFAYHTLGAAALQPAQKREAG
jgi:UDPglucose 6-dehydrogenase